MFHQDLRLFKLKGLILVLLHYLGKEERMETFFNSFFFLIPHVPGSWYNCNIFLVFTLIISVTLCVGLWLLEMFLSWKECIVYSRFSGLLYEDGIK